MSKPVTTGFLLRKQYLPCEAVRQDHSLDQYIHILKKEGAWIHPSIKPAWFRLKNNLQYPGLKTTDDLYGPTVLARIPRNLLLTTKTALNEPVLFEVYKQFFYHCTVNWEDRVLATYLLYIYSKQQTIWYQMMKCMSKDIDILCFWPKEQILLFQDKSVELIVQTDLDTFEDEWLSFEQIMKKHKIIDQAFVTRENYKWIYVHLVSRCFGKFLECVTMVPFCEFFNHHISDVLYDFQFNHDNPFKNEETVYESAEKYQSQEERDKLSSSDGSNDSQDPIDEFQFDYSDINIHKIKWGGKISFNLNEKQTINIQLASRQLERWLEDNIEWSDFSIIFAAQVLEKIKIIENDYMTGRKKYVDSLENLKSTKNTCMHYRKEVIEFYQIFKNAGWKYEVNNKLKQQDEGMLIHKQFPVLHDDKFDYFTMRMNKKDQFFKNNQVYFCYGRLSNRMMLQRYGVALEGNKYEHVWVKIDVIKYLQGYPDMIQKMQNNRLSVKRRFKLKKNGFNLEIIQFMRLTRWEISRHKMDQLFYVHDLDQEFATLDKVLQLLKKQLSRFEEEGVLEGQLFDQSMGYHQYFITVYKLEKVKILKRHTQLVMLIQDIIAMLKEGVPFEMATKTEADWSAKKRQNYSFLKPYFTRLKFYKK